MAKDVLVAMGNSCLDEYYTIEAIPKQGEKAMGKFIEAQLGGMVANAASVYAGFGHPALMFDYMKDNAQSLELVEGLKRYMVDSSCISYAPHYPNNKAQIMLKDGERIIFVFVDTDVPHVLTEKQIVALNSAHFLYTTPTDVLQLVDFKTHIPEAKAKGLKIFMDVEVSMVTPGARLDEILIYADFLSINEQALEKLNAVFGDVIKTFKDTAILLLTQGEAGSTIYHKDEIIPIQPYAVQVVDTTGAGDTYNAAFLHAYQQGWSLKACGDFASAAASRAIMRLGARSGIGSEDDILRFQKDHR